MAKSTKKARASKPHPDFPLFPHASGRWAKKIRGKFHYFGSLAADPKGAAALNRWLDEKDDLLAGRTPRAKRDGLTVDELCQRFLHSKRMRVKTGELTDTTWGGYRISCQHIIRFFGRPRLVEDLHPEDFRGYREELSKTNGLVGLRNQVRNARMVFKYAFEASLIERPVKLGTDFGIPSARAIRRQRTPRMFEADEIRRMLDRATPPMKAMILLGLNCGFGNSDVERLPTSSLDLKEGWVTYPRPKTGTERRIPLWPETVEAILAALRERPSPQSEDLRDRVFLTKHGGSYYKPSTRYLTEQFRKFLQTIDEDEIAVAAQEVREPMPKLYRKGLGFYALRHVFETIGGESCDQVAVDAIMGHERGDMASIYRERISDERLRNVVSAVHAWLYDDVAVGIEPDIVRFPEVR